jgi:glycosyltransferase involved in cell wall biosynthesis
MKIGLLHNLYGQFSRGGAEKVVEKMVSDYQAAGQEVFLITTAPRGWHPAEKAEKNDAAGGLKIYYLPAYFYDLAHWPLILRAGWQIGNLLSWRKYQQIKKILNAEQPDLVSTHNLMGLGYLAPLAIRRAGIRHEHFLHDIQLLHPSGLLFWGQEQILDSWGAKIYQSLTRKFFKSPAQVISPSRWLLELHQAHGFFPESAAEVRPLQPKMDRTSLPVNAQDQPIKNFLFVGQIESHKGIFLLLTAWKKINNPNLKLQIVGEGQKLAEAKHVAADDTRIEFLGRLTASAVAKIMSESDCLIVPSLCYENSPTVIYEAHAAGLRVLAANLGGIPEITGPQDILFRPGDEEDLLQKIKSQSPAVSY